MDYRPLINLELKKFVDEFPDYTYGQLWYAIISFYKKGQEFSKNNFLDISDKEMYEAASKALAREREIIINYED